MANSDLIKQVEHLQQQYQRKLPPVAEWNPKLSGDMDMRIGSDGSWYHEGTRIQRQPLVNLFSTILKREGDDYFLVTPVEKWRIRVDDAPFVVVAGERVDATDGKPQYYVFTTNTDDNVVLDKDHRLWVENDESTNEPRPYIIVRDNLPGLIHRNVYYHLIEQALGPTSSKQKSSTDADAVGIESCGKWFSLS